jgi:hypothetical protein
MIFNIDENMIMNSIAETLESVGSQLSEEQFIKIVEAIDEAFPSVVAVLTYGMQESWKSEARNVSTGWGDKYAAAIKAKVTGNVGEIYVDEDLIDKTSNKPNMMYVRMVETGMKSFSIKDALLKSEKAKVSSDGVKYMVIPFPVAAPRKTEQGSMQSKFGGREMTQEMHNIVKSGKRLKSGTLTIKGKDVDVTGLSRFVTRQHHEQYGIFRVVSEKSTGWIHPGVAAEPVFPKVLAEVNKQIHEVVSSFCREIVKEYTM